MNICQDSLEIHCSPDAKASSGRVTMTTCPLGASENEEFYDSTIGQNYCAVESDVQSGCKHKLIRAEK